MRQSTNFCTRLAGQLLFDVQPGLFRVLSGPLVDKHLFTDLLGLLRVFNEVDLQLGPEKVGHGLLDKFVVDSFLGLVFVAGLGREVIGDQYQGVLDVVKGDLALTLGIFVLPLQPAVDSGDKGGAHRLVRGAAVLQPGGVVVMLDDLDPVGKTEGHGQLHLVLRLVGPVPAFSLRLPEHRLGQCILPHQL